MVENKWKSVSGETFKFDTVGQNIEGELLNIREGQYFRQDGSKSKVFDIRTADGKTRTIFGQMILERLMQSVKIGDNVKIVYKGKVITKRGTEANQYEVFTE